MRRDSFIRYFTHEEHFARVLDEIVLSFPIVRKDRHANPPGS